MQTPSYSLLRIHGPIGRDAPIHDLPPRPLGRNCAADDAAIRHDHYGRGRGHAAVAGVSVGDAGSGGLDDHVQFSCNRYRDTDHRSAGSSAWLAQSAAIAPGQHQLNEDPDFHW